MKRIKVPILTEEYKIVVFIGDKKELYKQASKYLGNTEQEVEEFLNDNRGCAINTFGMSIKKHPLILINGDFPWDMSLATLAHEASHAMDYIQSSLGINDMSGEIHGHGIASVMRHCLKFMKK